MRTGQRAGWPDPSRREAKPRRLRSRARRRARPRVRGRPPFRTPSRSRYTVWASGSTLRPGSARSHKTSFTRSETPTHPSPWRCGLTSYLNLIAQPAERQWSWWGRVIFHVADLDGLYERARAAGFSPASAPRDAEWGERYFHLTDPDGHDLSFA